MRHVGILLCLLLNACAGTSSPTVAIRDVTLIDVRDGSLVPGQTVLIAGKHIAVVGTSNDVRIPRDAELLEAAGCYLIPGLWDMHVHSVTPVAADTSSKSIAAQDWHFPLFLAYGVTGVRNMNDGTGDLTLELSNAIKRQLTESWGKTNYVLSVEDEVFWRRGAPPKRPDVRLVPGSK